MYHSLPLPDPAGYTLEFTYCWSRGQREPIICIPPSLASRNQPSYTVVDDIDGGWDEMSEVNGDKAVGAGETGRLKLNIIGTFSASVDGHEVSLGRKAQALLGYMMLSSARQLPRTK